MTCAVEYFNLPSGFFSKANLFAPFSKSFSVISLPSIFLILAPTTAGPCSFKIILSIF